MEIPTDTKKVILEAKNICLIPSQEPESLPAALALFYTLKELGKNVNLIVDSIPESLQFLIPSLDFISQPKNFVISIPRNIADISQIYYEKTEEQLKIHLTADKGKLKKEAVSFYFEDPKPDMVITVGVPNFQSYLKNKLDAFGYLLSAPILNIDNHTDNQNFGQHNIVQGSSLSEMALGLIDDLGPQLVTKNSATCLFAGLSLYYENFKSPHTNANIFRLASELTQKGADIASINEHIYRKPEKESDFLGRIFQNLQTLDTGISVAMLESKDFYNFSEPEAAKAIEKINLLGLERELLVLWQSHASDPMIKGFFYSKKPELLERVSRAQQNQSATHWVFVRTPGSDVRLAANQIIKLLY